MKLCRYGARAKEKPGLIDAAGCVRGLSAYISDISGAAIGTAGLVRLAAIHPALLPLVEGDVRYSVPVSGVEKFIAIGLNCRLRGGIEPADSRGISGVQ